jgi:murein endopeptidase
MSLFNNGTVMTHHHCDQDDFIIDILLQIANENNESLERIKTLMLIKQNQAINNRFWEILDIRLPNHPYQYVGCCGECGAFELREEPPTP